MRSRSILDVQANAVDFDANALPAPHDLAANSGREGAPQETQAAAAFPDDPVTASEDGAGPGHDAMSAAPFALLDTSTGEGRQTTDLVETSVSFATGSGSINVIGTPIQETGIDGVASGLHIAPPVNVAAVADTLFAPVASAPTPAAAINLASLTPALVGAHGAEFAADAGDIEAALSHSAPQAGAAASPLAVGGASLAFLENAAGGSPVTDTGIGSGGATAAQVRQALGESGLSVNGSGIKVGVISDSFNDLGGAATDEADGALPSNVQVLKDLSSGGTDEGRAMMQIIHDIAPGASLSFYTADVSEQDFANGIIALANAGAKVIVDDVGYFDEPFFQNGVVAQAIQTVEAEGVTYVTAAGNEGSNGYQASFTAGSGTFDGVALTNSENFGGSLTQTVTINSEGTGQRVPLVLEWNQAYGAVNASTADLKMLIFQNGSLVGTLTNASDGEATNPWIEASLPSGTYQIAIENTSSSSTDAGLIFKEITWGDGFPATISGSNTGTVVGHSMTPGAITAGAVFVGQTPAFGSNPAVSETFSSSGAGTELLFANNGAALSSPDLLSPVAVSGVDGIATSVPGGLSDFFGTSASSASLAGVAALILSADPNLTAAQVEQIMEQTALSMGNTAVAGAGLVQVNPAVAAALRDAMPIVVTGTSSDAVQGGAPVTLLSAGPIINDSPNTTLSSATIKIANGSGSAVAGDQLVLNGSLSGVTTSWNATTDTLTLSGSASIAAYQTLLSEITYQDTGTDTSSGSHPVRTVTWTINDGTNSYSTTSTVTVDRAPTPVNDTAIDSVGATVTAAAASGVLSNDTDLDGDKLAVTGVSDTSSMGTVGASLAGTYGHLTLNADGSYSYVADNTAAIGAASNGLLHDIFTYTVSDGKGGTSTAVLNVAVERPPVLTTSNLTENPGVTLAASSLFTVSDPNGNAITNYELWDATSDPNSGHFYLNGVLVPDHVEIDITAAQLSQVTFVTGTDGNMLELRAFDGFNWSAPQSSLWSPFNISISVPPPPVLTTSNLTENPGVTLAASSLFTVSDPDGLAITKYELWDATSDPNSGHFYFNGVLVPDHTELDITAAQLSQVTFVTGTDGNMLEIRAFDGVSWSAAQSALWAAFNINIAVPPPPVLTTSNLTENPGVTLAASSLFTVSDPDGLAITKYELWDATSDPNSGHFYFNGVLVPDHTELDITAAQLSQVTFVTGTDGNMLEIRAFDGVSWSAAQSALWAPFNINIAAAPPPVLTTSDVTLAAGQTVAASSLFTVSDPDGLAITNYELWDRTSDPNSGHFYFNGVLVPDHTELDITAAQLSEVTFVAGTDSTALEIRAFDGVSWSAAQSALWAPFNVNVAVTPPPVLTTSDITLAPHQTVAASSLFTVSDPNGYAITNYELWDRTSDPNSGHFYYNGVLVPDHTELDITAAQLSQVTFVAGTDSTALEIRAFDGVNWSAPQSALWAPFNVNVSSPPPPVVTTSDMTEPAGMTLAASSLFTVSDPNGYAITNYEFWDRTSDPNSGHFYFNGVVVPDHVELDVTAAQLSEVTFVTGTDSTALELRAFDGFNWSSPQSSLWSPFNVNAAPPTSSATATLALQAVPAVTLSSGATAPDNFVFAPNFGQATVTNFNPVSDMLNIDHTMFANVSALLAATHDDVNGNAVITDALHETITIKNVTTAQLAAHQADFHFV